MITQKANPVQRLITRLANCVTSTLFFKAASRLARLVAIPTLICYRVLHGIILKHIIKSELPVTLISEQEN